MSQQGSAGELPKSYCELRQKPPAERDGVCPSGRPERPGLSCAVHIRTGQGSSQAHRQRPLLCPCSTCLGRGYDHDRHSSAGRASAFALGNGFLPGARGVAALATGLGLRQTGLE
jgi:hypothetical protein